MGRAWIWLLVPALLLVAVVAFLLLASRLRELTAAAPAGRGAARRGGAARAGPDLAHRARRRLGRR